jgi:hypothetical protein
MVLEIGLRALHMLGKVSTTELAAPGICIVVAYVYIFCMCTVPSCIRKCTFSQTGSDSASCFLPQHYLPLFIEKTRMQVTGKSEVTELTSGHWMTVFVLYSFLLSLLMYQPGRLNPQIAIV